MSAKRGNDGMTAPRTFGNSIAKTQHDQLSWWQVDLTRNHVLARVVVVPAHNHPLRRISVIIKDPQGGLVFNVTTDTSQKTIGTTKHIAVDVPQVIGRYVRVQLVGAGSLALAEVMVYPPS